MKLIYFVTEDWFFCSHFLERAIAAKAVGYQVSVITRINHHADMIKANGINLIPITIERSKINIFTEILLIKQLLAIYRDQKPDIVHHVALKPIIYGSLAAKLAKLKAVVNAPVGMGYVFSSQQLKAKSIKPLILLAYKCFLNPSNGLTIFENPDDLAYFAQRGIVNTTRTRLIRGAGVNMQQFQPSPAVDGIPVVMLVARMLWDKGVGEFVAAAKLIQQQAIPARFVLIGAPDHANPESISEAQLIKWQQEGIVEWWGQQNDMPTTLKQAHIVCLPSYAEGLPRALIEAAAAGKPIVTTNVPGCREIVKEGENGFLVPAKTIEPLASALLALIKNSQLRHTMGTKSRELAVNGFSSEQVIRETLAVYQALL